MYRQLNDVYSKYPKSIVVEGEFGVSEAAEYLSEKIGKNFSDLKVLGLAADGCFDVIAKVYNPIGLAHTELETDSDGLCKCVLKGVECFSGFFLLNGLRGECLDEHGEGRDYLGSMANGEEGQGISRVCKQYISEDGFEEFQFYTVIDTHGDCVFEAMECPGDEEFIFSNYRIYPSINALSISKKDLDNYVDGSSVPSMPVPTKGKPELMGQWILWKIIQKGLRRDEPMPWGFKAELIREIGDYGYVDDSVFVSQWRNLGLVSVKRSEND